MTHILLTFRRMPAPAGLALDPSGNIYVADRNNNRIRKLAPDGTVSTVAGSMFGGYKDEPAAGRLGYCSGLAPGPDNVLYVADVYGEFAGVRMIGLPK